MRRPLLALILLAALVPAARGEMDARTHLFHVSLGGQTPLTDLDTSLAGGGSNRAGGAGVGTSLRYLYHLTPQWALGAEAAGGEFSDKTLELPFARATIGGNIFTIQAVGRWLALPKGVVSPYLLLGVGVNTFNAHLKATPDSGKTWASIRTGDTATAEERKLFDRQTWGMAASFGGGLEGELNPQLVMGAELRWNYGSVPHGAFGVNSVNWVGGGLHVGWKFETPALY